MTKFDARYQMKPIPKNPVISVSIAIDYYLYDFLRRLFYAGKYARAFKLAQCINKNNLDIVDLSGLTYLRKRLLLWKFFRITTK
jgi:hypothetical protein